MKTININKITKANKHSHYTRERLHKVYIGNDLNCYFSNFNEAEWFIAETNRMLNKTAQELNRVFIEVWCEQRKIYLTYHKHFMRMNNKGISAQIERQFDLMLTRSHWENGNSFTFTYLYQISDTLDEWINEIMDMLRKNNKNNNVDDFKAIRERLSYIKQKLDSWGKKYNEREPPAPYDKRKQSV